MMSPELYQQQTSENPQTLHQEFEPTSDFLQRIHNFGNKVIASAQRGVEFARTRLPKFVAVGTLAVVGAVAAEETTSAVANQFEHAPQAQLATSKKSTHRDCTAVVKVAPGAVNTNDRSVPALSVKVSKNKSGHNEYSFRLRKGTKFCEAVAQDYIGTRRSIDVEELSRNGGKVVDPVAANSSDAFTSLTVSAKPGRKYDVEYRRHSRKYLKKNCPIMVVVGDPVTHDSKDGLSVQVKQLRGIPNDRLTWKMNSNLELCGISGDTLLGKKVAVTPTHQNLHSGDVVTKKAWDPDTVGTFYVFARPKK